MILLLITLIILIIVQYLTLFLFLLNEIIDIKREFYICLIPFIGIIYIIISILLNFIIFKKEIKEMFITKYKELK